MHGPPTRRSRVANRPLRVALLLVAPEPARSHPALAGGDGSTLLRRIVDLVDTELDATSCVVPRGGAAGIASALERAASLLADGRVDECVVGAADSLINECDIDRLLRSGRLARPHAPHGVLPGEAAAFVRLRGAADEGLAVASVLGVGQAREEDAVDGPRYSQGRGLEAALRGAVGASGLAESTIGLRITGANGERYHAWETLLAEFRFYRTWRPALPTWYPASSLGDVGAAAGVIQLVLAERAIRRGYAPTDTIMCEATSESGWRCAAVVGTSPSARRPPFPSVRAFGGLDG